MGARLFALADIFDAMRFDRHYRKKCSSKEVAEEVEKHSGTQFDPALVEVFNDCLDELEAKAAVFESELDAFGGGVRPPSSTRSV